MEVLMVIGLNIQFKHLNNLKCKNQILANGIGSSTIEKLYLSKDFKIDLSSFKTQKVNKNEDYKSYKNCTIYLIGFDSKGKLRYK